MLTIEDDIVRVEEVISQNNFRRIEIHNKERMSKKKFANFEGDNCDAGVVKNVLGDRLQSKIWIGTGRKSINKRTRYKTDKRTSVNECWMVFITNPNRDSRTSILLHVVF